MVQESVEQIKESPGDRGSGIPRRVLLGRQQVIAYVCSALEDIAEPLLELVLVSVLDDFLARQIEKIAVARHEDRAARTEACGNRGRDTDTGKTLLGCSSCDVGLTQQAPPWEDLSTGTTSRRRGGVMQAQRRWGRVGRPRDTRKSGPSFRIHLARRSILKILAMVLVVGFCGPFPLCPPVSYNSQTCSETALDAAFFKTAADWIPSLLTDPSRYCFQSFLGSGKGSFTALTLPALHIPRPLSESDSFKAALLGNRALAFMLSCTFSPRSPPSCNSC